ncbi:MAG: hypothetical protein U0174_23545 [Polyangiaceae bacterium]
MRCPACLAEAIGSGKYCASCGTRILPADDAPAAPEAAAPAQPTAAQEAHALAATHLDDRPGLDSNDLACSQTEAPPPVDPFASTANPSDGEFRAAAMAAASAANAPHEAPRVSPLASSSFDIGSEGVPVSLGPLPAAGNPPVSLPGHAMAGPASVAPRSKHGSTVLLSAIPSRAPKGPGPVAAAPPPAKPVQSPQPPAVPLAHGAPPASGYMQGPPSRQMSGAPHSVAGHAPAALPPGSRVIVTFPNGQRVFGTIWQCAQAHYLVQFPDGKSQWIETALVRAV